MVIIQIYGPIEGTAEEEVLKFYAELQYEIDKIREQYQKIIIIGDWNARVGRDVNRGEGSLGRFGEETLNRNGKKMLDFCQSNDLIIGNTFWEQKEEEKYTFVAEERNSKSLIDYIVYTKNLEQVIENIKTEIEPELSTEHRMVTATIKERIERTEERQKYYKINIKRLKEENTQERYRRETDQKLKSLEIRKEKWTLEERWTTFKDTIKVAAEKACGTKSNNPTQKRTKWWSEEVRIEIKKKKRAWKRYLETKNEQDKEEYTKLSKGIKRMVKNAKKRSWEEFGNELQQNYTTNNRGFWAKIKAMEDDKRKEIRRVKDN